MTDLAKFLTIAAIALAPVACNQTDADLADKPEPSPTVTKTPAPAPKTAPPAALAFVVKDIAGNDVNLAEKYAGKVVLIVNVASRCGFTKQYKGLQQLHEQYADKGLAVLGFPCNQFRGQEPGTNAQILQFCRRNYGVEFDMFAKIDVNGPTASALYKYLTSPSAPLADTGSIKWNFEKFLIDRTGVLIARYRTKTPPIRIAADIEKAMAGKNVKTPTE